MGIAAASLRNILNPTRAVPFTGLEIAIEGWKEKMRRYATKTGKQAVNDDTRLELLLTMCPKTFEETLRNYVAEPGRTVSYPVIEQMVLVKIQNSNARAPQATPMQTDGLNSDEQWLQQDIWDWDWNDPWYDYDATAEVDFAVMSRRRAARKERGRKARAAGRVRRGRRARGHSQVMSAMFAAVKVIGHGVAISRRARGTPTARPSSCRRTASA